MSVELRSSKKDNIYLIGNVCHQITGSKLPLNRQVLTVLFYNIREVKLTKRESANLVIRECVVFWEKARIPTKHFCDCVKTLIKLHELWRDLQKIAKRSQAVYEGRRETFKNNLDNLFDIAHENALQLIKIEEDRAFSQRQRETERPGYLAGVDKKLAEKEERLRQRVLKEEIRRIKCFSTASTSSAACDFTVPNIQNDSTFSSDMDASSSPEKLTTTTESAQSIANRGRKYFITPKLASALNRCQLSIRDAVFILQATIEALGYNIDDFLINKSSIQRIRTIKRKQRAKAIEVDFQLNVPEVFTLHWDSKLLPALNVRGTKEERLPIVISYENKEKLLAVPKLANSSGKEQAQAVFNTINE